jgi:hypothetical protein
MSDRDVYVEKNGITLAKVKEDGTVVDGLTEQELNEQQQKSVRKLVRVI